MRYITLLLLLCVTRTSYAIEISGTGANSDIAKVIATAAPNETVVVPANAAITLTSGLTIFQNGLTLQCQAASSMTKSGSFHMITVTGSNVTIDGCVFDGAQAAGLTGRIVSVSGVSGFTLRNSTITNASAEGVAITGSSQIEIASNTFAGNTRAAIWVFENNSSVWIHDNNIDASNDLVWHKGISAHSNNAGRALTDVSILNNVIKSGYSFCVEIGAFGGEPPQRVTVSGNVCEQQPSTHKFGGFSFDTVNGLTFVNNTYENQTASDVSLAGIELVNGTSAVVSSNRIVGAYITVNKQTHTVVQGNTVKRGFTGSGIYVGGTGTDASANYNTVSNNIVDMQSLVPTGRAVRGIWVQANSSNSDFSHNQIVGNTILGDYGASTPAVQVERDSGTLADTMISGNRYVNWQTCYVVPYQVHASLSPTKVWNNDEAGCSTVGNSLTVGIANGVVSYRGDRAPNTSH